MGDFLLFLVATRITPGGSFRNMIRVKSDRSIRKFQSV
jgi:hypothetical protein